MKKKKRKRKRKRKKEKRIGGDSNILAYRFLLCARRNTQGIEEYKGIAA
jgi:hypothetical protein